MFEYKLDNCSICKEEYTSNHIEATPGLKIYVCDNCFDAAKYNFIWICLSCGKVYIRPKALVIRNIKDHDLKRAYILCQDKEIIQGIEMCIECDPDGIVNFLRSETVGMEC